MIKLVVCGKPHNPSDHLVSSGLHLPFIQDVKKEVKKDLTEVKKDFAELKGSMNMMTSLMQNRKEWFQA